jgi:hypothetical protein
MPREIQALLFDYLEYVDALCLAHTCRYLWVIGHYRLVKLVNIYLAPWAGDRILCIGDYNEEPPPSTDIFSEHVPPLNKPEQEVEWNFCHRIETEFEEVFFTSPLSSITEKKGKMREQLDACISCAEVFGPQSPITLELWNWSRDLLSFVYTPERRVPIDQDWALRNLDTSEYVTLKGIAMNPSNVRKTYASWDQVDLLSVLLYRITWSTEDNTGSQHPGLHQGSWVGHRFDVTPVERILTDGSKSWKDISGDVRRELYDIAVSDEMPWAEAYKVGAPINCRWL